jgi:endo-1,4-beta-xylanase
MIPLLGSYVSQAQNLILNGGFENDLDKWWTQAGAGTSASFTVITAERAEGAKALKVEVITPGANAWNVQAVNDAWASVAGESYTMTFWAKAEVTGSSFKAIQQLENAYAEKTIALTNIWQQYEWTFTAGANNLQLKFHFPTAGTFYIDGINIPSNAGGEDPDVVEALKNGGFESGSGNSFTNWWMGAGNGTAAFTAETTDIKEGSRALKAVVTAMGSNSWDIQAVNDAWPSVAGQSYTLSFWAKAATADARIKAVQQVGNFYDEKTFTLTTTWQQYQWEFTAKADNMQLKFQFLTTGTFYLDKASIPVALPEEDADVNNNELLLLGAETGTAVAPSNPGVFQKLEEGGVKFVRVQENLEASQSPGTDSRIMSYTLTFPAAGTYDLYARLRVGAEGFNDDSFYYGNGFGAKSATNENDWITVNGLSPVGHTAADELVTGGGTAQNGVWKWIKLSEFDGGETPVQFTVTEGNLTQTFQIGSRENGLDIDKFAFGPSGLYYTVDKLDKDQSGSATPPPPPFIPTGEPLATGKQKFLGNVYSTSQLPYFENYWNQVTPENSGKWGAVETSRDVMNWSQLDAAYAYAKENNFPFRFHVLIWGNQQPQWIEALPAAEQLEEIKEWFAAVAARYPDIDYLEVVNEPLHDAPAGAGNGNYIEALGGSGATGWDWVIASFRLARQYFPNTPLVLNDYSVTNTRTNAENYRTIIALLQAENLIDIIGIQAHAFETTVPAAVTAANVDLLAALNLPLMITELDIDGPDDQTQLLNYQRIFPIFWEHPSVIGVTLWGWKPGMWRTAQGAYLALQNGHERPALVWLRAYVENNAPVITAAQSFAIDGGQCAVLGSVSATDADANTTLHNWQISGGDGAGLFAIDAISGQISIIDPLAIDYTKSAYSIMVRVSDEHTSSAAVVVTISIADKLWVNHKGMPIHINKLSVMDHLMHGDCLGKDNVLTAASTSWAASDAGALLEVYPNPVKDRLTVSLGANELNISNVQILEVASGRVLAQQTVGGKTTVELERGSLRAGIYLLRMQGDQQIILKIILE